jgi:hypothetical protein
VKLKRDLDLIRLILIELEGEEAVDLSKYTEDQINYHKALLIEARLAKGRPHYSSRGGEHSDEIPDDVYIERLTWNGHEFLDQARSGTAWERAKKFVLEKGLSQSSLSKLVFLT